MSTLLSLGTPLPIIASPDPNIISVKALSLKTRNLISTLLNPPKVIPTEKGLPRDWRGLAHLCGLKNEKIPVIACDTDPTARVLTLWQKQEDVPCNISQFRLFLEELDRFDIIDDTTDLIEDDMKFYLEQPIQEDRSPAPVHNSDRQILTVDDVCRLNQGLDTQYYDAFVVFADEDIDFATELIDMMEKQYGLKLCVKERDLVAGLAFEHKAIIELISERCNRLIVILSPAFQKSSASKFIVNYAQALGIEQGKRKIIPCLYERCDLPQELRHYFMLDYSRSGKLWNFWEKLRDSIQAPPIMPRQRKIGIQVQVKSYNSEHLPDLKPVLANPNRNHIRPKKDGVKFGSLSNLTIPEPDETRLSASTTALYSSPSLSEPKTPITSETKKSKHKNWFKKLLNSKEVSNKKEEVVVKEKTKKFWLKKKIKVPEMN